MQDIIKRLETISSNQNAQPLYVLGGYIVGATLAKDGIEILFEQYPLLEKIAELGADLETLENDELAIPVFEEFQRALLHLKAAALTND